MSNQALDQTVADQSLAIAQGGVSVPVTYRNGRKEEVAVLLMDVDHAAQLLGNVDNYNALAGLATGRGESWARTLHPLSVVEICTQALDLNFAWVQKWADLHAKAVALGGEVLTKHSSPPAATATSSPS